MKMIEAVIKPHRLDAVKMALARVGVLGVTAIECRGFGRQMGHKETYRGTTVDVSFVPKILLKIGVPSEMVDRVVSAIVESARTGEIGDGKVFIYPLGEVIRVRTGERNEHAL